MGRTGYPEKSATLHQPAPRHIPEERMTNYTVTEEWELLSKSLQQYKEGRVAVISDTALSKFAPHWQTECH